MEPASVSQQDLFQEKRPLIIAHRGVSAHLPENTIASFAKAIDIGVKYIECDVQLTADFKTVIFHDEKLKRITSTKEKLWKKSADEIKKLDAGSWYGKEFQQEKIPFLEELLVLCKDKAVLNLELKPFGNKANRFRLWQETWKCVKDQKMENQVFISCFDLDLLKRIRHENKTVALSLLYPSLSIRFKSIEKLINEIKPVSFHCTIRQSRKWLMSLCKDKGIPVLVYTVNEKKELEALIIKGVGGIFTDDPQIFSAFL